MYLCSEVKFIWPIIVPSPNHWFLSHFVGFSTFPKKHLKHLMNTAVQLHLLEYLRNWNASWLKSTKAHRWLLAVIWVCLSHFASEDSSLVWFLKATLLLHKYDYTNDSDSCWWFFRKFTYALEKSCHYTVRRKMQNQRCKIHHPSLLCNQKFLL